MTTPVYVAAMTRASEQFRRNHGFSIISAKPTTRKTQQMPHDSGHVVRAKKTVSPEKQMYGSVCGVIRHHFDGEITVTLSRGTNWAAAKPGVRAQALAHEIVRMVLDKVDNRDNRLCDQSKLESELFRVMCAALVEKHDGLRIESLSIMPACYSVRTKAVKKRKVFRNDPTEHLKEAQRLRKQVLVRRTKAAA